MSDRSQDGKQSADPVHIKVPASKSLTQRALVLAALCPGESLVHDPLVCDDSEHLSAALQQLGVAIDKNQDNPAAGAADDPSSTAPSVWTVRGGIDRAPTGTVFCGNAGTCFRFLCAVSLVVPGTLRLDGNHHLRRRPCAEIGEALRELGAEVDFRGEAGFAPLDISFGGEVAANVTIDASRTSQFVSGLLMVGRTLPAGLVVNLTGPPVSLPYLDMTVATMAAFGATDVETRNDAAGHGYRVPPGSYRPTEYTVEGDWSAAAMALVAGRLARREVIIDNLVAESHRGATSQQGDRVIVEFLRELDEPREHVFDLHDCPDLITPLAVAAACADHPSRIKNVAHARIKECDRVAAMAESLAAIGVELQELPDGLVIQPAQDLRPADLDSRDDHRMAMAHGLLSLRQPGITTSNPACVSKSYPQFWQVLELFR